MLLPRLCVRILLQTTIFGALLFVPAGTLDWWQAWVLLALIAVGTIVTIAALFPRHAGILEERLKPPLQAGQPLVDKVLVCILLVAVFGATAFVPVDVFRLHLLLGRPPFAVSLFGVVLFGAGWWLSYRTLVENAFAALAVRRQPERHQHVVDTGVYAVVRHPMYAGAVLFFIGMALWLGSLAGTLAMLAPTAVLIIRITFEERFLRSQLDGYDAYTRRVRWRLIPGIW